MILLLALPVFATVALIHRCLQVYAPTNRLARRVRMAAPRFRTAAGLLAVAAALLLAMHMVAEAVASGAPGWLNLVVLVLGWDAIKLGWLAIIVAVRCVRCGVAAVHGADLVECERDAAANSLEAGRRAEGQWQTSTQAREAY